MSDENPKDAPPPFPKPPSQGLSMEALTPEQHVEIAHEVLVSVCTVWAKWDLAANTANALRMADMLLQTAIMHLKQTNVAPLDIMTFLTQLVGHHLSMKVMMGSVGASGFQVHPDDDDCAICKAEKDREAAAGPAVDRNHDPKLS